MEYMKGSGPVWFVKPGAKAHILARADESLVYGLCDERFLCFEVKLTNSISAKRQCKKCLKLWREMKEVSNEGEKE